MTGWDPDLAFDRARTAYRYVTANFPESADLEVRERTGGRMLEADTKGDAA